MELDLACMISVTIVHCSIFTLNMWSAQYLQLSGIISNRTSFCVVAFSFIAYCATLIPRHLLNSSGLLFKCRSDDNKYCGCLMSVGLSGGSGTVSIWMSFTIFSITSLDTCICCYLVEFSIAIACFPDIQTLATSHCLKLCVLKLFPPHLQFDVHNLQLIDGIWFQY